MNRFLVLFFILFFHLNLSAQLEVEARVEIPNWGGGYQVFPFKNKTVLTVYYKNGGKQLEIRGENLNVIRTGRIEYDNSINGKNIYTRSYADEDLEIYYLIRYSKDNGQFVLYEMNLKDFSLRSVNGVLDKKHKPFDFIGFGNKAYFFLEKASWRMKLYEIDLTTGEHVVHIGSAKDKIVIANRMDIVQNSSKRELWVQFARHYKKNPKNIRFYRFSEENELLAKIDLPDTKEHGYSKGQMMLTEKGSPMILGAYSLGKKKKGTDGIFVAEVSASNTIKPVRHYNYYQFKSFQEYLKKGLPKKYNNVDWSNLSDKEQIKMYLESLEAPTKDVIKDNNLTAYKADKKSKKGRKPDFEQKVYLHDVMENNGEYILLGECYQEEYVTYFKSEYDGHSQKYVNKKVREFVGYIYTHAYVISLSETGEVNWDITIPMYRKDDDYKTFFTLSKSASENQIGVVYRSYPTIKGYHIENGELLEDYSRVTEETNFESDNVKYELDTHLWPWYDGYVISYGYQRIKNKEGESGDKKERNINYLSKIKN